METLIDQLSYALIVLAAFLDSAAVVMVAGVAAERGYLHPLVTVLMAALGGMLGGLFKFWLGRRWGRRLLARHRKLEVRARRVERLLRRHETAVIAGFRFLYGMRAAAPLVLGAGRIRAARFFAWNAVGAALWAAAFAGLGYGFGDLAARLFERRGTYDLLLMGAILLAGLLIHLFHPRGRRWRNNGE